MSCYEDFLKKLFTPFFRHYQKGLRSDPEHGELKKAYFGLKNLLKKTKSVSLAIFPDNLPLSADLFPAAISPRYATM